MPGMKRNLIAYGAAVIVFLALDMVWLGVVAADFYRESLAGLLATEVRWGAAAVFYLMYVGGIVVFAIAPALAARSWRKAAGLGGLFGLLAYGTYDMTNLATLAGWPLSVALVDMVWGSFLTAASASGGFLAVRAAA